MESTAAAAASTTCKHDWSDHLEQQQKNTDLWVNNSFVCKCISNVRKYAFYSNKAKIENRSEIVDMASSLKCFNIEK